MIKRLMDEQTFFRAYLDAKTELENMQKDNEIAV